MSAPSDNIQDVLLNFATEHGCCQLVSEPKRDVKILDLLLSNEPLSICDVCVCEPFSSSDHNQVMFKVYAEPATLGLGNDTENNTIRCWRAADFEGMSTYLLAVDWDYFFVNLTIESIWNAFCDIMNTAIEQFVPVKHIKRVSKRLM